MTLVPDQTDPPGHSDSGEKPFRLMIPLAVAVGLFMENLDSTIIATSIPSISRSLGTTPVNLSMAVSVYLLSLAVFIPMSGWMADRFGARTVFSAAIGIFMASSALCGAADSLAMLVAARGLQGLGGAMMTPVGRLILGRSFSKRDLVTAMSYVTIPALIGPIMGPLIGGAITTYASWRWIFFINLPIGAVGIVFVLKVIDNFRDPEVRPPDVTGFVLCGVGLAGLVLGVENIGRGVLPEGSEIVLLATSLIAFFLYRRHARRVAFPALDLSLFRIPTFRASVLGGTIARMGFGATPFLLPLLFQLGFGRTPLESGALTFTSAVGALLMKFRQTQILRHFGFRRLLIGNIILVGLAIMALGLLQATTPIVFIVSLLLASGFLRSIQFTCMNALSYADLTPGQMSSGTAIASVGQQISMSLGVAVGAGALHFATRLTGSASPGPEAFAPTFLLVGAIPLVSILVFAALPPDAGEEMSGHRTQTVEPLIEQRAYDPATADSA